MIPLINNSIVHIVQFYTLDILDSLRIMIETLTSHILNKHLLFLDC